MTGVYDPPRTIATINTIVASGPRGRKTCYLNLPQPQAIEAWVRENAGEQPTGDMIEWFDFEVAFGSSGVWADRE